MSCVPGGVPPERPAGQSAWVQQGVWAQRMEGNLARRGSLKPRGHALSVVVHGTVRGFCVPGTWMGGMCAACVCVSVCLCVCLCVCVCPCLQVISLPLSVSLSLSLSLSLSRCVCAHFFVAFWFGFLWPGTQSRNAFSCSWTRWVHSGHRLVALFVAWVVVRKCTGPRVLWGIAMCFLSGIL